MSSTNTLKPLTLVNIVDSRLKCLEFAQEKLEYGVIKGAGYSNFQSQKANAYSQSGINWNFNTQGANTIIDKRIYAKCQFQVTMTGVPDSNTRLFNDALCSPRAYPLASITENATVTINGTSISCAYSDVVNGLLRYNTNYEMTQYDLSGTPTKLDNYAMYADGVASINNPLGNYQNSGYEKGRGSFKLDVIQNDVGDGTNPRTSIVKFTVVEPLMMSPMAYSSQCLEAGFIGVNNFGIQLNFSNLQRVWSQVLQGSENVSSFSVQIGAGVTEQPELLLNYLNTPATDEAQIPKEVVYDYFNIDTYQNDQNTSLNAGATQSFTNNSIQLSVVPRSIWVYCAVPRGSKTFEDTDTYFKINSISLQYLNVSGQLSSATDNDLYNLSVKNGCKMSYQEWSGETSTFSFNNVGLAGSVLRLDISDLAIPSNLAAGCNANSQLQFTINITNQSSVTKEVSIYVLVGNEGMMTITNNTMMTQLAVLTQESVLKTRMTGEYRSENLQASLYGGSFWSKLRNMGKTFSNFIKKTGLDKFLVDEATDVAKQAIKKKIRGGMMVGSGGALVGGRQMTRSELKALMDE